MRIGIMLRHLTDTMGGVVGYSHNLIRAMLRQGPEHHYALFYASEKMLGTYAGRGNLSEHFIPPGPKLLWDQRAVPRLARELELDVIFNPKLSVPLWARQRRYFVLRPEQFVHPEFFKWWDRRYFNIFIPRYVRACTKVIAPTEQATRDIIRYVGVDPAKMVTVHEACGDHFFEPEPEPAVLEAVRRKYHLPERYILFVGGLTPLKNFKRLVEAFGRVYPRHHIPLVVVGFNRHKFKQDLEYAAMHPQAEHIHFPGYVEDMDLPHIYRMATCLFFPSIYEGFGIPICEGQATGCPVITTSRGCCPEVAGDAALLVDPLDVEDMARGLDRLLSDADLRRELAAKGKKRVQYFRFDRCACQTLAVFAGEDPATASVPPR